MAFAHAFKDMHRAVCKGRPGLCDAMKPTKGPELLKYLRTEENSPVLKSKWLNKPQACLGFHPDTWKPINKLIAICLSGDKFRFDPNGDGPARYNIIHFKQVTAGNYQWVHVGEYVEGELRLNMSGIQFRLSHPQPPESVCSPACELGQAKKYVEGESCCWHCFNCSQYQIRHPLDETQCVNCPEGTVPDAAKQICLEIPEVFLRAESAWAIVLPPTIRTDYSLVSVRLATPRKVPQR
ncbi:hypothetical protein J6590_081101 [Homalodisca vitripennis]|nr:hypothetical protein J6590_081101 [Homalodisca vitripennis]